MPTIKRVKKITQDTDNLLKVLEEAYTDTCNSQATIKRERNKAIKEITTKEDMSFAGKFLVELFKTEGTMIDRKIKIIEVINDINNQVKSDESGNVSISSETRLKALQMANELKKDKAG